MRGEGAEFFAYFRESWGIARCSVEWHVCDTFMCTYRSGVYNDLGSGSNVDICVITLEGVDYMRNHQYLQGKTYQRQFPQKFAPGTARKPAAPSATTHWGKRHVFAVFDVVLPAHGMCGLCP